MTFSIDGTDPMVKRIPDGWKLADEWFAEFIDRCENEPTKRRRVLRERRVQLTAKQATARRRIAEWDQKTEQLRRFLAHEQKAAA